jgi:hypothetical protein
MKEELEKRHHRLGHPSEALLYTILKQARPDNVKVLTELLKYIKKKCLICTVTARAAKYFKYSIGAEDLRFTRTVAVEIMYFMSRRFLHIIDETTHFQADTVLNNVSAAETWKAISKCWALDEYLSWTSRCVMRRPGNKFYDR